MSKVLTLDEVMAIKPHSERATLTESEFLHGLEIAKQKGMSGVDCITSLSEPKLWAYMKLCKTSLRSFEVGKDIANLESAS